MVVKEGGQISVFELKLMVFLRRFILIEVVLKTLVQYER